MYHNIYSGSIIDLPLSFFASHISFSTAHFVASYLTLPTSLCHPDCGDSLLDNYKKSVSTKMVKKWDTLIEQSSLRYEPDLRKQDMAAYFSNSCLLNAYNLYSWVYLLAKFQLHILITYGVTALQSSNNGEHVNYRHLQKMVITYKQIDVQSYNFRHCTCHEQDNGLMGKFFFTHPSSLHLKANFMKKNPDHLRSFRRDVNKCP